VCSSWRRKTCRSLALRRVLVAAIYIKYNIAFLLIPSAVAAFAARGWQILLDRQVIIVSVAGCVLSVPAMLMMYRCGSSNMGSFAVRPGNLARNTIQRRSWGRRPGACRRRQPQADLVVRQRLRIVLSHQPACGSARFGDFIPDYSASRSDCVYIDRPGGWLARQPSWRWAVRPMVTAYSGIRPRSLPATGNWLSMLLIMRRWGRGCFIRLSRR
jgi:hypothetical protein